MSALEAAHAAGGAVDVAVHLPPADHPHFDDLLTELLRVDVELCWGRGVARSVADHLGRFPRLASLPASLSALAYEEYRARRRAGQHPSAAEFRARYGVDTSGWPADEGDDHLSLHTLVLGDGRSGHERPSPEACPAGSGSFFGYELVRELAVGPFARVYLARQPELAGRFVVLKVAADLGDEPATLARLQHTNIVPVYAVHRRGPLQAFCMPYHGTATLADLLRDLRGRASVPESGGWIAECLRARAADAPAGEQGLLRQFGTDGHETAVLRMFARLAGGLAYAHERGVLHLDLKPSNVLVADDGEPMLLDFHLASDAAVRRTAPAAYVGGTLPYMSRERLVALRDGMPHESAVDDVFAFGLMLAEALTGVPAVTLSGRTAEAVVLELIQARSAPPLDVRARNPRVSPGAAAVVAKCLDRDPACRYPSASELADDLDRHLTAHPLRHARNSSVWELLRKWGRRHPRLASGYTVGVVATVLVFALIAAVMTRTRQLEAADRERQRATFLSEYESARLVLADPTADARQTRGGLTVARRALARAETVADPGMTQKVRELYLLAGRGERVIGMQTPEPNERAAALAEAERLFAVARGMEAPPDDTARSLRLRAADDMDRRKYRSAANRLRLATRHEPADPMGWFLLGVCLDRLAQPDDAAAAYTVVVALRPESAAAYYRRGAAFAEAKKWADAVADFDAAIRLAPDLPAAYLDRGLAKAASGDARGADEDFTRVLEFPDPPTRVYFLRARVRAKLGDADAAATDHREGLAREPTDELSWISRGVARIAADPNGAVDDFDAALRINPDSAKALENKAHVLAEKLGRTEDAVRALDHAIATNPDYPLARAGRGVLLARLGNREGAVADATAALELSTAAVVLYQAGCVFALVSREMPADRVEAVHLLERAVAGGFGADLLARDPDLDPLRRSREFESLLARVKAGAR